MNRKKDQENPQDLNEAQKRAVALIASGWSGTQIASELGISEGTLSRWRKTPQFKAAVNQILSDLHDSTKQKLRNLVGRALETIEVALTESSVPIRIKLDAAFKLLQIVQPEANFNSIGSTNVEEIEQQDTLKEWQKSIESKVERNWINGKQN